MTRESEGKHHGGEPKKPDLLATGEKAKEIVEVLAEMYRAVHGQTEAGNKDDSSEHASK